MPRIGLIILLALFVTADVYAQIPLVIKQGDLDTVHNRKIYVIGVTDPGIRASINGRNANVYNTGAFGSQLTLSEGRNTITVSLTGKDSSLTRKWNVVYLPQKARASRDDMIGEERSVEKNLDVSTLPGAYLQLENGAMGYIDSGIPLEVIRDDGDRYKVQLSDSVSAYIPKGNVTVSEESARKAVARSWTLSSLEKRDRIVIDMTGRVPYLTSTSFDPSVIELTLYGVKNNGKWIAGQSIPEVVDYVSIEQVEDNSIKASIKLKGKYFWGYSLHYEGNRLIMELRHAPKLSMEGLKIGLDAGHGGEAQGAVSTTGIEEKNVNLSIVKRLESLLESKGAVVVLSRKDDSDMSMDERKNIFKDADIDLLVSVHNNAGGNPLKELGASTYYRYGYNRDLAECLLSRITELDIPKYGLTGNFSFALNGPTEYPNALVECMFLSSLPDEEKLADEKWHDMIAEKIALGIEDYIELVKTSETQTD